MKCKDCYHCVMCNRWDEWNDSSYRDGYGDCCLNYSKFIDKSQVIELPMKTADKLKEELTKYCYKRCVDEL